MQANLMVEHIPRLRRYARTLTRDHHAVDDLVQDTFERALNKLHLWQPDSDMRAWLFSVMHSVFVNQWHIPKLEVDYDPKGMTEIAVQAPNFDRIELGEMEKALQSIPREQRDVLLLVAVEEMSYEQAAETLAIPIGTVMSRLSRAREKLRQIMRAPEPG